MVFIGFHWNPRVWNILWLPGTFFLPLLCPFLPCPSRQPNTVGSVWRWFVVIVLTSLVRLVLPWSHAPAAPPPVSRITHRRWGDCPNAKRTDFSMVRVILSQTRMQRSRHHLEWTIQAMHRPHSSTPKLPWTRTPSLPHPSTESRCPPQPLSLDQQPCTCHRQGEAPLSRTGILRPVRCYLSIDSEIILHQNVSLIAG